MGLGHHEALPSGADPTATTYQVRPVEPHGSQYVCIYVS